MTLDELVNQGLSLHQQGNLAEAESLYRQVLAADPRNADAWHLLGALAHQVGQHETAIEYIRQSLALLPANAQAETNLGLILVTLKRYDEAIPLYRSALAHNPGYRDAHFSLGTALLHQKQLDEAEACFRRALEIDPRHIGALNNLGTLLVDRREHAEAEVVFRQGLQADPANAKLHYNLGNALGAQGRYVEAIASVREALRLDPNYADAYCRLAELLIATGAWSDAPPLLERARALDPALSQPCELMCEAYLRAENYPAAEAAAREALRINPNSAAAHCALGNVLARVRNTKGATAAYERAIELAPREYRHYDNLSRMLIGTENFAAAVEVARRYVELEPTSSILHRLRGTVHAHHGRYNEALAEYNQAAELEPEMPLVRFGRSILWLMQGDLARGWPEYEWRLRMGQGRRLGLPAPRWNGEPLEGRTLLLYSEQGFGDTLQFVRYAPLAQARGGRIVLETFAALLPILSTATGIDQLAGDNAPLPPFDLQAPLLSLPGIFGVTLETLRAEVPYLRPDLARVEKWRGPVAELPGLKVGIAWQGDPKHASDRQRSIPLAAYRPLAGVPSVTLLSLQRGPGEEQIATAGFPLVDWTDKLDRDGASFMDTAAVLTQLDLLITSDTAIAHLAGALGVRTWIALSLLPDWRWLVDRDDSPWYPTVRLFRQRTLGDWHDVFARIAGELANLTT